MTFRAERQSGGGKELWFWGALAFALLAGYILSPVPVAWTLELFKIDQVDWVRSLTHMIYWPLGQAYQRIDAVRSFYEAYGKAFGVDL